MSDEWIKFEDEMPKLNLEIEVKIYTGEIKRAIFCVQSYQGGGVLVIRELIPCQNNCERRFKNPIEIMDMYKIYGWRPYSLPERKPNFDKLKKGDYIYIEYENNSKIEKILSEFSCIMMSGWMELNQSFTYSIKVDAIKKLIRIDIENKKFEEI